MMNDNPSLIHTFDGKKTSVKAGMKMPVFLGGVAVVVVLGVVVGFLLSKLPKSGTMTTTSSSTSSSGSNGKAVGIADTSTFKDKAEGTLREGGVDGEGSFHLERPGGESQNVYLTSSTVDLSKYIGKKVRVWGQTFQAQKAGWLMDVGLVEPIN